jgi:chromosome segregation ATPase
LETAKEALRTRQTDIVRKEAELRQAQEAAERARDAAAVVQQQLAAERSELESDGRRLDADRAVMEDLLSEAKAQAARAEREVEAIRKRREYSESPVQSQTDLHEEREEAQPHVEPEAPETASPAEADNAWETSGLSEAISSLASALKATETQDLVLRAQAESVLHDLRVLSASATAAEALTSFTERALQLADALNVELA